MGNINRKAAETQLAHLEWARDCYDKGLAEAVEQQIAYLRDLLRVAGSH